MQPVFLILLIPLLALGDLVTAGLIVVPLVAVGIPVAVGLRKLLKLRARMRAAFRALAQPLERRHDLLHTASEKARDQSKEGWDFAEGLLVILNDAADALRRASRQPGRAAIMQGVRFCESRLAMAELRLAGLVETCPALQQDAATRDALQELAALAGRIASARQAYNDAVIDYNQARDGGTRRLIAFLFDLKPADLFVVGKPTERELPKAGVDESGH